MFMELPIYVCRSVYSNVNIIHKVIIITNHLNPSLYLYYFLFYPSFAPCQQNLLIILPVFDPWKLWIFQCCFKHYQPYSFMYSISYKQKDGGVSPSTNNTFRQIITGSYWLKREELLSSEDESLDWLFNTKG